MTKAESQAYQRQSILLDVAQRGIALAEYAALYNSGLYDKKPGIACLSAATLYRWKKNYREGGVEALTPNYNSPQGAGSRTLGKEDKQLLQAYYLDENRSSLAHILRLIERHHSRKIDYSTARRYIASLPKALLIRKRQGAKAYNNKVAPFIRRDYENLSPMEIVSADHHMLDILCRHPLKGTPFRPWLTMILDYRSRKPLGWQVSITPNRHTILASLEQCVENHGIPDEIHIDNGKDFRSKLLNGQTITVKNAHPLGECQTIELQGVFGRLGTAVHFVTPYRGQAKPVERFFRFVAETFSREFPSYVGSNTAMRPEDTALYFSRINGREKQGNLPEIEDVATLFSLWAGRYSQEHKHRGQGMHRRTPNQVFEEEATSTRPVMPQELRALVFAEQFKRTVQRTGISIGERSYYSDEIVAHLGWEVIARRPFKQQNSVIVFGIDGRRLFTAQADYLGDTGDARENSRRRIRVNKKQIALLDSYLEEPAEKASLPDELQEARKAAGSEDVASISYYRKPKKEEGMSAFFKGV